ncbi:MAG: EpsG family protein [Clostridia bacterium]
MKEIFANSQYIINLFIYLAVAVVAVVFAFLSQSLKSKRSFQNDNNKPKKPQISNIKNSFQNGKSNTKEPQNNNAKSNCQSGKSEVLETQNKFNGLFFSLSFLTLALFALLAVTGMDRESYTNIIDKVTWQSLVDPQLEFGFELICIVLKAVFVNPYVVVAVISVFVVALNFFVIFLLRQQINIGFAVLMYVSIFYFQMFNLTRIYLSAALCLLSGYYLCKDKKTLAILFVAIAFSIHYTALMMFVPMIIFWIFKGSKLQDYQQYSLIAMLFLVGTIGALTLLPLAIETIPFMQKYHYVLEDLGANFGVAQFVYFLPMFAIIAVYNHTFCDKNSVLLAVIYMVLGFAVGMISYKIIVFGRMSILIELGFVVVIPYMLQKFKEENFANRICRTASAQNKQNTKNTKNVLFELRHCVSDAVIFKKDKLAIACKISIPYICTSLFVTAYLIARLLLYFNGYFFVDKLQELRFLWEFVGK